MQKRVFLLTGSPGVGKTTVLMKCVKNLSEKGVSVGGMVSSEIREGKARVGFEIQDLTNTQNGILAHVNQKRGPKVGKYRVNLEDLHNIGVQAIRKALMKCDLIAIDEIGPMELFSEEFKEAVGEALKSRKLVLAVVHYRANDEIISKVKSREDAETIIVAVENRKELAQEIVGEILKILRP
jgi:nucleoside-triphosphatase